MEAVRSGGNTPEARPCDLVRRPTMRGLVVVLTKRTNAEVHYTDNGPGGLTCVMKGGSPDPPFGSRCHGPAATAR